MKPTIKNLRTLKTITFHIFFINANGSRGTHFSGADFFRVFHEAINFLKRQKPGEHCYILTEESYSKLLVDGIYSSFDKSQQDPSFGQKVQPYALKNLDEYILSLTPCQNS